MEKILKIFISMSISGTTFFIMFYLASIFMKKMFSARWYMIFLKVNMIFYLVPIRGLEAVASKSGNYTIIPAHVYTILEKADNINNNIPIFRYIFYIWVIGVIMLLSWNIYCYIKFSIKIKKTLYIDEKLEYEVNIMKLNLGIKSNVRIRRSTQIFSPMIIGIIKPIIIFPSHMKYSTKLKPVIVHELIHCKRGDLVFKLIQNIISVLNWFNPVVYLMNRVFEMWSEISCDEVVVENMSYCERKEYGNTILEVIEKYSTSPNDLCFYLCNDKNYIKRRLLMMVNTKKISNICRITGGLIICLAIVVTIKTGINVSAAMKSGSDTIINQNVIKDSDFDEVSEADKEVIKIMIDDLKEDISINGAEKGAVVAVDVKSGDVLYQVSIDSNDIE